MNPLRDVIIIGAGPSGSFMADLLARRGIDALLLEEHASPGDEVVCSGIIGMEAFDCFDLPEEGDIGFLKEVRFISPSGETVNFRPERPLAKIVSRQLFDTARADRAVKNGAELLTTSRVESVSVNDRFVEVGVNRGGEKIKIKTRLCVFAPGYGSSLVRRAGFRGKGKVIQGAQTILKGVEPGPTIGLLFRDSGQVGGEAPQQLVGREASDQDLLFPCCRPGDKLKFSRRQVQG